MMELPCVQVDGPGSPSRSPGLPGLAQAWSSSRRTAFAASPPAPNLPPPQRGWRQVQLAPFGCAVRNTASECSRARALAVRCEITNVAVRRFCKDQASGTCFQKAQTGLKNSFQPPCAIDQAGERLFSRCRRAVIRKPPRHSQGPGPSGWVVVAPRGSEQLRSRN